MTTRVSPDPKWRTLARRNPAGAGALAVMAKAPLPRMVKTRLVPPLSPEEAAELSRALLLDLLDELKSFQADRFVAFTPAEASPEFQAFVPGGFACFAQAGKDLGERMRGVFVSLFDRGYRSIVVVGSDLPVFPSRWLEDAFSWLNRAETDIVLGPSRDGGYYLIGMSRLIAEIFHGIPWSSNKVLSMTLQRLTESSFKPYLLPRWFDIDNPEDLRDLASHIQHSGGCLQERTTRLVAALREQGKLL